jgi:hypothetical protein
VVLESGYLGYLAAFAAFRYLVACKTCACAGVSRLPRSLTAADEEPGYQGYPVAFATGTISGMRTAQLRRGTWATPQPFLHKCSYIIDAYDAVGVPGLPRSLLWNRSTRCRGTGATPQPFLQRDGGRDVPRPRASGYLGYPAAFSASRPIRYHGFVCIVGVPGLPRSLFCPFACPMADVLFSQSGYLGYPAAFSASVQRDLHDRVIPSGYLGYPAAFSAPHSACIFLTEGESGYLGYPAAFSAI